MTRVFGRGELKAALLEIVASLGEGHGYAIMQELQQRVAPDWRPSPGAIYPALVGLEEAGLLEAVDAGGLRAYRLTPQGHRALEEEAAAPRWHTLATRVRTGRTRPALGSLLKDFEAGLPRRRQMSGRQASDIARLLQETGGRITQILEQGDDHG